jgi:hypothetical protein
MVAKGAGQLQTAEQLVEPLVVAELEPGPSAVDQPHRRQVVRADPPGHRQCLVDPLQTLLLTVNVDQYHC